MALARALAVEPTVLLLDEPFGALDAKVRKELRDWLRRLHDEVHVTTVFVTHDQEEALEVADEIVVINEGRVEQIGTPDQLYDEPANDFVMGFLGEVTTLGGVLLRPHDIHVSPTPSLAGARRRAPSRGAPGRLRGAAHRAHRRRRGGHGGAHQDPRPRARPGGGHDRLGHPRLGASTVPVARLPPAERGPAPAASRRPVSAVGRRASAPTG